MADNKTNLVDLTLLNTAYKINKKRIDLLSEQVKTKNLEVGTATTNGTLTVYSGDFRTDTLEVNGKMTINGGGVTLPSGTALTLSKGGSVTKSATFDSLTGSVKFGNAVDANGNVTGSAQIVVPTGESLSLSGSANTNGNTTIEGTISASTPNALTVSGSLDANGTKTTDATTITGTIKSADITVSGSAVLEGSKLQTTTITNGTINLKSGDTSNELTVTGTSTGTISGGTLSSNTIKNGTIDLNTKTLQLSEGSTSKISNGIIYASITNSGTTGSIDLNGNNLKVSNDSTITLITEGNNTTIEGVAAIKAKSMELTNTANNSSSLIINNTFGGENTTDNTKVALYCTGGITGAKVYNAVWNDLADAIEVPLDTKLEYGYCYKYKEGKVYKTDSYADSNVMGIHSDTAGMILGLKNKGVLCINLAVAGMVLAYVDKEYECGTALVATKDGKLTKANKRTRLFHPERIVATFYKTENSDFWGSSTKKVAVNGRSWVKIK